MVCSYGTIFSLLLGLARYRSTYSFSSTSWRMDSYHKAITFHNAIASQSLTTDCSRWMFHIISFPDDLIINCKVWYYLSTTSRSLWQQVKSSPNVWNIWLNRLAWFPLTILLVWLWRFIWTYCTYSLKIIVKRFIMICVTEIDWFDWL